MEALIRADPLCGAPHSPKSEEVGHASISCDKLGVPQAGRHGRQQIARPSSLVDQARRVLDKLGVIEQEGDRAPDLEALAKPANSAGPEPGVFVESPSDCIPIPDQSSKQVFLSMPVSSADCSEAEYATRFAFVAGELKKAIDSDEELCDRVRFIDYDMYMVGRSRQTAAPAIVVWCKKTDTAAIRALFNKRATTRLFAKKESRWARIFGSDDRPAAARSQPPFSLVYCQTDANPTTRNAGPVDLASLHPVPHHTMCGSRLGYRGRSATVALTLEVDGVDRVLTVDHLFDQGPGDDSSASPCVSDNLDTATTLSGGSDVDTLVDKDIVQLRPLWTADTDPESIVEPHQLRIDDEPEGPSTVTHPLTVGKTPTTDPSPDSMIEPAIPVQPPLPLHPSIAHLDWKLVDCLQTTILRRRNLLVLDKEAIHIREFAEKAPAQIRHVYLISGLKGVRRGRLLRNYGYIGSRAGQEMCRVWSLALDDNEGITPGECGSVVVDAETHMAYGHVVGSRPPGFASVVPLVDTIAQIRSRFNATKVCLPQEELLLAGAATTEVGPKSSSSAAAAHNILGQLKALAEAIIGVHESFKGYNTALHYGVHQDIRPVNIFFHKAPPSNSTGVTGRFRSPRNCALEEGPDSASLLGTAMTLPHISPARGSAFPMLQRMRARMFGGKITPQTGEDHNSLPAPRQDCDQISIDTAVDCRGDFLHPRDIRDVGYVHPTGLLRHATPSYARRGQQESPNMTDIPLTENQHNPNRPFRGLELNNREIRLLGILPSEHPGDPLVCRLSVHRLDDVPHFEALSYAWGNHGNSPEIISLNGVDFPIKYPNLQNALHFLRQERTHPSSSSSQLFWIDAICIDQECAAERLSQVRLMGEVYGKADAVVVWLGNSTHKPIPQRQQRNQVAFTANVDLEHTRTPEVLPDPAFFWCHRGSCDERFTCEGALERHIAIEHLVCPNRLGGTLHRGTAARGACIHPTWVDHKVLPAFEVPPRYPPLQEAKYEAQFWERETDDPVCSVVAPEGQPEDLEGLERRRVPKAASESRLTHSTTKPTQGDTNSDDNGNFMLYSPAAIDTQNSCEGVTAPSERTACHPRTGQLHDGHANTILHRCLRDILRGHIASEWELPLDDTPAKRADALILQFDLEDREKPLSLQHLRGAGSWADSSWVWGNSHCPLP